ncbi:AarF/UbiB family protein [Thauera sp.]|uniref:AarF/UbiB family protein n=1 Tax=Thauera sp. TaxID=1905334 RepID=UPI002639AE79|nr:AarF/UbiB family protein [Thauera sp.]
MNRHAASRARPDPDLARELFASLGLDALLPEKLAGWRTLLAEAMAFFLDRLPEARLAAIVAEQFALADTAAPGVRIAALLAHCPTLHKLGQVIARHPGLDAGLRHALQALESMPPTTDIAPLLAAARAELGGDSGVHLAERALAEGSVAIVLPCSWREHGLLREGVLKALKPGVALRLGEELAILPALGDFLVGRGAELGLPAIDYHGYLAAAGRLLKEEIRLDREQAHMRIASTLLAADAHVFVPALLPWCTPALTAMERIHGAKLADAIVAPHEARRLGRALVGGLLARPFWSPAERALFHGDLHGGNLLRADDGRIAVLDWSLAAHLDKAQREALVDLALAALALDTGRIASALAGLGLVESCSASVSATVDQALDNFVCSGRALGFDWLIGLLDALALQGGSGFGEQLAVFRKSWLSLAGVLGDLGAGADADLPLIDLGVRRLAAEWPARLLAPADSRAFATHVSTADLWRAAADIFPASLRYWARLLGRAY